MIATQLIAAHNATMECYRRAMIGEQTLEGRRDNLSQANKLSRTYAVLLDALHRYRGKGGQQKVTVEHVHVPRRRAGGGGGGGKPGGGGSAEIRGSTPCKTVCPCTSADGVERGQGARHRVDRRRCRTAAAECTAGCPREPRRVTRMPSSTDTIRLKQSRFGWFLGAFPTCGAPPSRKPCRGDQRSRAEGSPRSCARSDECRCSPAPTRNSCPLPCPACGNSCRDWPG